MALSSTEITIVSSMYAEVTGKTLQLEELLEVLEATDGYPAIFHVPNNCRTDGMLKWRSDQCFYVVWKLNRPASVSPAEDGRLNDAISSGRKSFSIFRKSYHAAFSKVAVEDELQADLGTSHLSYDKHEDSVLWLKQLSRPRSLVSKLWTLFARHSWESLLGVLSLIASLVFVSIAVFSLTLPSQNPGIATPTSRYLSAASTSQGPRHQLNLVANNVSQWANSNDLGGYIVRLDDQSLIPNRLVTEREETYQSFLRARYPQLQAVVDSGKHLDPWFLAATDAPKNLITMEPAFHLTHCIVALRRYFDAKENNAHVCPRDIGQGHVRHCLGVLEDYAFNGKSPFADAGPDQFLIWGTDVCF